MGLPAGAAQHAMYHRAELKDFGKYVDRSSQRPVSLWQWSYPQDRFRKVAGLPPTASGSPPKGLRSAGGAGLSPRPVCRTTTTSYLDALLGLFLCWFAAAKSVVVLSIRRHEIV